jgi:hypothetical protein
MQLAVNAIGSGVPSPIVSITTSVADGAPQGVKLVSVGTDFVVIAFDPPTPAPNVIYETYRVNVRAANSSVWQAHAVAAGWMNYSVSGLVASTAYVVQVQAQNRTSAGGTTVHGGSALRRLPLASSVVRFVLSGNRIVPNEVA